MGVKTASDSLDRAAGGRHIALLRARGLRPTRQRVALAGLLFCGLHRHVSAEQLRLEVEDLGISMSLATIYNTLNQFTRRGLLHEISLDNVSGHVTIFDTNTSHHHHFFDRETRQLIDVPASAVTLSALPTPPEGRHIERVDVVICVSSKEESGRRQKKTDAGGKDFV